MDTFAEIADERRGLADLLTGLTDEQRAVQSLCTEWTVQDVAAHLVVPLEVSLPKFMVAILASGGNFDRANDQLARKQAQRPFDEIVAILRQKAEQRFTPPGEGPEAPLTDLLVHGLDIRVPLHLTRTIPDERVQKSLTWLARGGHVPKGTLEGLRFKATDVNWTHGSGPAVSGTAETLLLVMSGRTIGLEQVAGDGVATLRGRLSKLTPFTT